MKYLIQIVLFTLLILSCNQNKIKPKVAGVKPKITNETIKIKSQNDSVYKVSLEEKRYNLSMYNNKYVLRVIPDSTALRKDMIYRVLLTKKTDTIINQSITMDTIVARYHQMDNDKEKIELKEDYYLSRIQHGFVRERYLRLVANLKSNKGSTAIMVNIQFEYLGSQIGKLTIY